MALLLIGVLTYIPYVSTLPTYGMYPITDIRTPHHQGRTNVRMNFRADSCRPSVRRNLRRRRRGRVRHRGLATMMLTGAIVATLPIELPMFVARVTAADAAGPINVPNAEFAD